MAMTKRVKEELDRCIGLLDRVDPDWKNIKYVHTGKAFNYEEPVINNNTLAEEICRLMKSSYPIVPKNVSKILCCEWQLIGDIFKDTGLNMYIMAQLIARLTEFDPYFVYKVLLTEDYICWECGECDIYPKEVRN